MFLENPQSMVALALLHQEERRRKRVRRAPVPSVSERRRDLSRWGCRLAGMLGEALVTMGHGLQALSGEGGTLLAAECSHEANDGLARTVLTK